MFKASWWFYLFVYHVAVIMFVLNFLTTISKDIMDWYSVLNLTVSFVAIQVYFFEVILGISLAGCLSFSKRSSKHSKGSIKRNTETPQNED